MEALTMKFKYDKSKGLLFFINPLLPVKGYSFMNICAIMFTRSEDYIKRMTQAAQVAMRQNKGAAYPAGLQYTYNAPSFPFSGRFGDVSWHEGIGHMVGDNNPQILKANPGINNRVDYESFTPLESQVYSSQPNERHADTWGFRGANVNMKDANGNYYIDPNRQLSLTETSTLIYQLI